MNGLNSCLLHDMSFGRATILPVTLKIINSKLALHEIIKLTTGSSLNKNARRRGVNNKKYFTGYRCVSKVLFL